MITPAEHQTADESTTNPSRPGPVHDRAMHYIVEGALDAFCDWLRIKVEGQAETLSSVFAAEKRTADLLLRIGPSRLLHVEYIRKPKADMFARMVGYRGHIMRRYQGMSLLQYAIVLGPGRLRYWDDPEAGFFLGLNTIHLPEVDPDEFLSRPGLAVLAELTKGDQQVRARSAVAALKMIRTLPEERQQGLREAMLALATISLDASTINLIRKETGMTVESLAAFYSETDVGQKLVEQGREQGLERGREQGREQGLEQGREQGLEQGREQGLKQGREQGRERAQVRMLATLIRRRFGDDAQILAIAALLAQIPEDESIDTVIDATSLDDLVRLIPNARPAGS